MPTNPYAWRSRHNQAGKDWQIDEIIAVRQGFVKTSPANEPAFLWPFSQ
jgi:hypothetical protein